MKSNEEIIEELNIKDRDIEIKVLEALQAKDNEAVLAVEIVTRNMEEAHRQEKIELVDDVFWRVKDIREMLQTEHSYGLDEWSTPVKNLKILEEKLTQLKDENQ